MPKQQATPFSSTEEDEVTSVEERLRVVLTTVAAKLVVLFPQIDEKEHHDGRRSKDDCC